MLIASRSQKMATHTTNFLTMMVWPSSITLIESSLLSANAHPDKPPILQATDSKWWGWKDALAEVGITVHFLCPDYVKAKYAEKMGA